MNFNKIFKIVSISLFGLSVLVSLWYLVVASNKDCLACTLPKCEKIDANGEKYLAPADDCAMSYAEIKQMEEENAKLGLTDVSSTSECSKECMSYAGTFMTFAIVMSILAVVLVLLFAVYQPIANPKTLKGILISLGSILFITLVSYLMSSDAIPTIIGYNLPITVAEVKIVDTLLYMTYLLLGISILGILYSNINKFIRK